MKIQKTVTIDYDELRELIQFKEQSEKGLISIVTSLYECNSIHTFTTFETKDEIITKIGLQNENLQKELISTKNLYDTLEETYNYLNSSSKIKEQKLIKYENMSIFEFIINKLIK
jgi:hypothetical protein